MGNATGKKSGKVARRADGSTSENGTEIWQADHSVADETGNDPTNNGDQAMAPIELPEEMSPGNLDGDPWTSYYAQSLDQACVTSYAKPSLGSLALIQDATGIETKTWFRDTRPEVRAAKLPILIDSGASGAVVGLKWLRRWDAKDKFTFGATAMDFRFGDGKAQPSRGEMILDLMLPSVVSNLKKPLHMKIATDVAHGDVPLLISKAHRWQRKGRLIVLCHCLRSKREWRLT